MTPQEIYSQFLEENKRILHLGCGDRSLKELAKSTEYVGVGLNGTAELSINLNTHANDLPDGFDYVVLDEILEVIDDPVNLITASKKLGEIVVIYEFKYEEDDPVKDHWKKPWKSVGLESILTQNFDLVNNIFLGYATIHFCTTPYNPNEVAHVR